MKKSLWVLSLILWAATAFAGNGNIRRSSARIPGSYIVVLQAGADLNDVSGSVKSGGQRRVQREYRRGIKGIAVQMSDAEAQALARDPRVDYVEEDSVIATTALPWGPDRIDQRSLPLDGFYNPSRNGTNVLVYVFDTGVSPHEEYAGRLLPGFNATGDALGTTDCNGHGTNVAGIIGGTNYGVAEGVQIVPIRVLGCDGKGTLSALLAGIEFVIGQTSPNQPAVANMSLAGHGSSALDAAVNTLIDAGVTTVVAAGNDGGNACDDSPARVPRALTVGATDSSDNETTWSNYGPCVDIFAPGQGILSASNQSTTATLTLSGTSQAAPFVTGVAALWLEGTTGVSPDTVALEILSHATPNVVMSLGDMVTPNRLVCTLMGDATITVPVDQLIPDSGFDDGEVFWGVEICTVINQTGCPPSFDEMSAPTLPSHSGTTHASLGGNRDLHLVSAPITIPSNASAVNLVFWLWVVTKENDNTPDDVLKVEVRNAAGNVLQVLGTYSNLSESKTYRQHSFDLSAYRGKTIRVSFTSTADRGQPTRFLLDDVELNAQH
jgi:subtilisin family serine protease